MEQDSLKEDYTLTDIERRLLKGDFDENVFVKSPSGFRIFLSSTFKGRN